MSSVKNGRLVVRYRPYTWYNRERIGSEWLLNEPGIQSNEIVNPSLKIPYEYEYQYEYQYSATDKIR